MTRINLVPPAELSRNHLIAEYSELPRVVASVKAAQAKGKTPSDFAGRTPSEFTLGPGHMLFFYTRLAWLTDRYAALVAEMQARGYETRYPTLETKLSGLDAWWFGNWTPTERDIAISRERIELRLREPLAHKNKRKGA